ncbi:DUF494 family protein [Rhodocyclus purpureus]|uniref:DUF494 family protein n=1 Tax=Rhodocyclus purpureus TaxID=1067 RepID=UPI0019123483|nr:DUF494 domain-containing protein [Rhodocyclus purpureus]MBK5913945.1 hypothetical protein [Rhodocyclus purpureus]
MIDILVYLFENYQDLDAQPGSEALAQSLTEAGFDDGEISFALDWLDGLHSSQIADFVCSPRSLRIYTEEERRRLGSECLDFVIFLEQAGVITPALRELIIDRGLALDEDEVPIDKFKVIVLIVLWSRDQDLEPLIVEELLSSPDDTPLH